MVTLAGFHGDHPATGERGWRDFAGSLPDPAIAELIAASEPLTEVVPHRMVTSRRHHVERLREVPGGLVLLGDAVASFNPIYGQGMSSAALQAAALAAALDRCDGLGPGFVRRYHRLAGRAVSAPWRLSVGGDFAHPLTAGPRPGGTRVTGRYLRHALRAAHSDEVVALRLVQVSNLVRPPAALLAPSIAARVLRARWRGPAAPPLPQPEPAPAGVGT
jgi:2-polyprenyl-6-methoxyphenol hydroxylase-like FAD-dependent oxidoreductase